jgi:hypothetical protein
MADVTYWDHDGELGVHERTFQRFVHLAYIAVLHAANVLVALAIGGVEGHWPTAVVFILLASVFAIHGLTRGAKWPMAIILLLALLALCLHA